MKKAKSNRKRPFKFRLVTSIWPTADLMDQDLIIDIEKQSVTNRKTGHTYIPQISGNNPYYQINYSKHGRLIRLLLHNILFYHYHRYLPEEVDHIDFNKTNNKIENLRGLAFEENRRYKRKKDYIKGTKTSSRHKGVTLCRNHLRLKTGKIWRARVVIPKNHPLYNNPESIELTLGHYTSEDEAGQAVNDKIRELGLEEISVLNDTPQERARKSNLFEPVLEEIKYIKDLFENIEPQGDMK